ncbi:hypothetical protein M8R60_02930 [Enterobacter hormaechei]|nr:hypothetical protein [Enterobacter hormaechei]
MAIWNAPVSAGQLPEHLVNFIRECMDLDLMMHESKTPPVRPGGHCIHKHLNKTDAELDARCDTVGFNGTYSSAFNHDLAFVETLISRAILDDIADFHAWFTDPNPMLKKHVINVSNNFVVGRGVLNSTASSRTAPVDLQNFRIVFALVDESDHTVKYNGHNKTILTAYPKA